MVDAAPVVTVTHLKKTYRTGLIRKRTVDALQGVSFEVRRGEIFGLLGPNGAGKTTLIKVLLGIVKRSGGEATVLGRAAGDRRGRQRVGYLPEHARIPRHLTGNTALEFYGQLSDMSLSEIRRKREDLLKQVGLAEWGSASVKTYSKGMLQRLGLAQAMLHDPELLILDEPTDGVDPVGRAEIRKTLFALKAQGKTVFLNSHLLQELELVCDRVGILQLGKLRHVGPVKDLTDATTNDLVLGLVGDEPTIRRVVQEFHPTSIAPQAERVVNVRLKSGSQADVDRLVDALRKAGVSIQSLTRNRMTLEEAFLQMLDEPEFLP
jgi:ABC-2 type transport system ATP-binding protein